MKKRHLTLTLSLMVSLTAALAQPTNDECSAPISIPSVLNFCSSPGAYTNVGATPSTYGPATCFGTTQGDVWFSFVAEATDVSIVVTGATAQAPGGTLQDPQVALYFGSCGGTINQLECQSAPGNSNIAEGYQGGLFVGSTYLIRIQGQGGQTGTFQICINNYNPPVDPKSDCPQSSILCDKSPFVVQKVTGAGTNTAELNDALCFSNGIPGNFETNSTWYVWTCSKSGTLEFTLTPLNVADDLDFALYRLPNGIGNCTGKQLVRCMASGDNANNFPSPCMGPTGLKAGDPDISEDAGCNEAGDDAWLRPFDMVQGETYALVVNNFTSTGNGFGVQFGGSGEFLGPEVKFQTIPNAVCLGTPVQVIDASTFALGSITSWKWSFGADAMPQTAIGPGPHNVQFNQPGDRPVVLQLETDLGCKVTDIQVVKIYPDVEVDTVVAAPDCNGTANGEIKIDNIAKGTPPYQYSWNNGPFGSDNTLKNLGVGTYTLVIKDANNCQTDLSIEVKERVLTAIPEVTKPLCFGEDNGIIKLNVTNGKAPVQFDWGSGFVLKNPETGFLAGVYTIQAIDAVLCKGTFNVTVADNPLLELAASKTDITCFGANDGTATATPTGGVGNYKYLWSDGQTTAQATGLLPGQYTVTLSDGNECTATASVTIIEPADVGVLLSDVLNLKCNGIPTGEIRVEGQGGRQPYTFSTDGTTFFPSDTLKNLAAGSYWVKIRDAGGCLDSVFATISQPVPLQVFATPSDTTIDLGFTVDLQALSAPPGRPVTFLWSPSTGLSCTDCPDPTVQGIDNQVFVVKITDEDGCMALDTVRILVDKDRPVYVPNVFAPSKPYPNDHFTLFGGPAAQQILLFRVYDRWGSLIFETGNIELNDPNLGWDGRYKGEEVIGVFTFYATVRFVDQSEAQYEGGVTVVR